MEKINKICLIVFTLSVASAYATPFYPVLGASGSQWSVEPNPVAKVGNPYEVGGITYFPKDVRSYEVVGTASWYGDDFHGKLTANGEVFDKNELTAAHTTLPMPSFVEVTNLANGKSLILRVNDRGPFVGGRDIDVSKKAAELLGFKDAGTAKVKITLLKGASLTAAALMDKDSKDIQDHTMKVSSVYDNAQQSSSPQIITVSGAPYNDSYTNNEPKKEAASSSVVQDVKNSNITKIKPVSLEEPSGIRNVRAYAPRGVFVQIGAFTPGNSRVESYVESLSDVGVVSLQRVDINGHDILRLRVGPYGSIEDAVRVQEKLIQLGYDAPRVVVEQ